MAIGATLDRTIYTESGLRAAVEAFAELADVHTIETTETWMVELHVSEPEKATTLVRHFLNYALAASLEERLG
jgi:hypothetical protein